MVIATEPNEPLMTGFVKCPACGWLHFKIPAAAAHEQIRKSNEMLTREDCFRKATLDMYLHCFRCGADSAGFVPAQESDAPSGATIQAVIVER